MHQYRDQNGTKKMKYVDKQRYYPGQLNGFYLAHRHVLIAVDGPLRIQYRNPSLDWLLSEAPHVSITLLEGESHVLPYAAFVEVSAIGADVVTAAIIRPAPLKTVFDALSRFAYSMKRQLI
jgi:hypothetical protein